MTEPPSAEIVSEAAQALLAYGPEELLEILKEALPSRLEVLQELVDWAAPDHVYGGARALLDARYVGVVKSYSETNGYGFITSTDITAAFGTDLFVHGNQIKEFAPGMEVNFAILLNKGKPHAFDLKQNPTGSSKGKGGKSGGKGADFRNSYANGSKGSEWGSSHEWGDGWGYPSPSSEAPWRRAAAPAAAAWRGAASSVAPAPPAPPSREQRRPPKLVGIDWGGRPSWGKDAGPKGGKHHTPAADQGKGPTAGYAFAPQPPQSAVQVAGVTDRRFEGSVKSLKEEKFGFLNCEELQAQYHQDIYVHWNNLRGHAVGDLVSFAVIVNEQGGLKAVDLAAPQGRESRKRFRT